MTILGGRAGFDPSPADCRRLIRGCGHAALATSLAGHPYASLVAAACDMAANPLLLLSDLAQHSANIAADPRVSLLFAQDGAAPDPLAAPRLTLIGRVEPVADGAARARFVARHPSAVAYAGFADFHLYRVVAERGHLVAGFGRIAWLDGPALRLPGDFAELAAAEPGLLAQHGGRSPRRLGPGWRLTGLDPDGADLRRDDTPARLDFAEPALTPAAARSALAALLDASGNAPSR